MGALGFLGARSPEVQHLAHWSWLSLFSLLVLIPTMDVESRRANYRLHPRRKWALVSLVLLGFLGFLFTDHPQLAMNAMWAMFSQFAIDHRKSNPTPVKELMPIFVLLLVAIVLPVGGMLWFMTQAVRNEQMAVRQRLTEVYESQLDAVSTTLESGIQQRREALGNHADLPPSQRFDMLVRESIADGILILDENGKLEYPGSRRAAYDTATVPQAAGLPASKEALALQTEVRNLLRAGSFSEARLAIDRMAADTVLGRARDEGGRLLLPALQLFYLQSAPAEDSGTMLESLRNTVVDYEEEIPSARRLFYLQALSQLGAEVAPWLGAEGMATEIAESFKELPSNLPANGFWVFPDGDTYLLFSDDGEVAAVFNGPRLLIQLQELINASLAMPDVRILLEQGHDRNEKQPWTTLSAPGFGGDWFLNLYVDGDDPFAAAADRRIVRYFWIGNGVIALMVFVIVLLARHLLSQQRLTRMKNDFVATVTHELKTPLASMRLFVDTLLERRCRDEQQQREYLELIARENKRLSRLIDNFLTFSRMERNKRTFCFEDVSPTSLATNATDAVRENYECGGCDLTLDIAENLPPIVADEDAMITVLLNLLDNACKYSDGDKRIELRVFEKPHAVCFQVRDNGIGMAKRELAKILDRFYQVDQSLSRKCGGAGLGLSIVDFIVEAHGGKIDIESEPGKGSVFTVGFPVNGRADEEGSTK